MKASQNSSNTVQPTRRERKAPQLTAVTGSGLRPFGDAALALYDAGLCPIPLGDDRATPNKRRRPLVRYRKWQRRPSRDQIAKWVDRHPNANIGILTELSGITVVDVDDASLVPEMLRTFGPTPFQVRTPSGGAHLWYRSSGEHSAVRLGGLAVDIKGRGGMVVVPPSIRPGAGTYVFEAGDWADLDRLPVVGPDAVDAIRASGSPKSRTWPPRRPTWADYQDLDGKIREGGRNQALFRFAKLQASVASDREELCEVASNFNFNHCDPPLNDAEVERTINSIWRYREEGRLIHEGQRYALVQEGDLLRLSANTDAACFTFRLRIEHTGVRDEFVLDARALSATNYMPGWPRARYLRVIKWLVETGEIVCTYKGGRGPGDASKYTFPPRSPDGSRVQEQDQIQQHTAPPVSSRGEQEGRSAA